MCSEATRSGTAKVPYAAPCNPHPILHAPCPAFNTQTPNPDPTSHTPAQPLAPTSLPWGLSDRHIKSGGYLRCHQYLSSQLGNS